MCICICLSDHLVRMFWRYSRKRRRAAHKFPDDFYDLLQPLRGWMGFYLRTPLFFITWKRVRVCLKNNQTLWFVLESNFPYNRMFARYKTRFWWGPNNDKNTKGVQRCRANRFKSERKSSRIQEGSLQQWQWALQYFNLKTKVRRKALSIYWCRRVLSGSYKLKLQIHGKILLLSKKEST